VNEYASLEYLGHSSSEFGLYMTTSGFSWQAPVFQNEIKQINGRSSGLISTSKRFNNVVQEFPLVTGYQPTQQLMTLRSRVMTWLYSQPADQYRQLIWTKMPNYFFNAVPTAVSALSVTGDQGTLTVSFSMEPFLYQMGGFIWQPVMDSQNFHDESVTESHPLFHVSGTGSGSFSINGASYEIVNLNGDIWIDSDLQIAYDSEKRSVMSLLRFDNYAFPTFKQGDNIINVSGISLEVQPRWRQLL